MATAGDDPKRKERRGGRREEERVNLKPMMMVVQDGGEEADNLKGEEEGVPKFRGKGHAQRRKASCFCVKK